MKEKIYLTKLAPNCGCAAKVGPGTLAGVLCKLPKFQNPDLLVGTETSDDAAVYRISDELAMIQTLDFFTPVADDPYDFGQIAAANALSDVYAMGGEPKTALNIVAFPKDMDVEILGEILKGGADKVLEAGAVLAGGHTIQDDTPKYGLSDPYQGTGRGDYQYRHQGRHGIRKSKRSSPEIHENTKQRCQRYFAEAYRSCLYRCNRIRTGWSWYRDGRGKP